MRKMTLPKVVFFGFYLGYLCLVNFVLVGAPNRYFDLTYAIVDEGRLTIDSYHTNTPDKAYFEGHYYTAGLPGPSLLGVPSYWLYKQFSFLRPSLLNTLATPEETIATGIGDQSVRRNEALFAWRLAAADSVVLYATTLVPIAALGVLCVFLIAQQLGATTHEALVVAISWGAATPALFFSTTYLSHSFATTAGLGALYCLLRWDKERRWWQLGTVALLLGVGLTIEYGIAVLALVMICFVLWRRPSFSQVALGVGAGIVGLLPLLTYNLAVYHTPLASPHEYLPNPEFVQIHSQGWFGMNWPSAHILWHVSFGDQRGIFGYAPILLLVPFSLWQGWRDKAQRSYIILLTSLFLAAYCYNVSYVGWLGGGSVGPRFMLIGVPAACLLLLWGYRAVPRWIFFALMTISIFFNLIPFEISTPNSYFDYFFFIRWIAQAFPAAGFSSDWLVRSVAFVTFAILLPTLYAAPLGRKIRPTEQSYGNYATTN